MRPPPPPQHGIWGAGAAQDKAGVRGVGRATLNIFCFVAKSQVRLVSLSERYFRFRLLNNTSGTRAGLPQPVLGGLWL